VCFHCKTVREEAYEQKRKKAIFSQDSKIFTFDKNGFPSQLYFSNSAFKTECERTILKRIPSSSSGSTDPIRYPLVKQTYVTGERNSSSSVRPTIFIDASFEPSDHGEKSYVCPLLHRNPFPRKGHFSISHAQK
jgi:hypothetical protein